MRRRMIYRAESDAYNERHQKNSGNRTINITKLARAIVRAQYDNNTAKGYVDRVIKDDPEITTKFVLVNEGVDNTRKELSVFDSIVIDVASMLVKGGAREISLRDIFRIIYPGSDPTNQRLRQLEASIDRLIGTYITIDCHDEFAMRRDVIDAPEVITGPLLPLDKGQYSGKVIYTARDPPARAITLPLLDYAAYTGQIATISSEWFDIPTAYFSQTSEAISIMTLVILRIEQIIRGRTTKKVALLWDGKASKGLIERLGYRVNSRDNLKYEWSGGPCEGSVDAAPHSNWSRQKGYIINVVEGTLQHLQDIGIIKRYTAYGRKGIKGIIGYDIII